MQGENCDNAAIEEQIQNTQNKYIVAIMSFVVGVRQLKIVVINAVKHASTYERTTKITINSTLIISILFVQNAKKENRSS